MRSLLFIYLILFFPLVALSQMELRREQQAMPLAGDSRVKALYSSGEEDFYTVLEKDFHHPYDSTFIPTTEKDVWLKFSVLNTDTFSNDYYVYSKDTSVPLKSGRFKN